MDFAVIAFPRSGSSLFRAMLNTNPHVCIPPESSFATYLPTPNAKFSRQEIVKIAKAISNSRKFQTWQIEEQRLIDYLLRKHVSSYNQLLREVYRLWCGDKDCILGDKNNTNWRHISKLRGLGVTKFIVIGRDPRAVHASLAAIGELPKTKWLPNPPKSVIEFRKEYGGFLHIIESELSGRNSAQFKLINFESLLLSKSKTLDEVADFLGVPSDFEDEKRLSKRQEPEEMDAWKALVNKPINANRIDAWRDSVRQDELSSLEELASRHNRLFADV